jgi:integrase
MARTLHRLSAVAVAGAKTAGYFADGGNLYLRVAVGASNGKKKPPISKGWIFRFTVAGRTRDAGLGGYPTVSLARARDEADRCRRLVAAGIDPIEARNEEHQAALVASAKAMTFEQCAKAFIEGHKAGWRNEKHRQQWTNTLETYAYPVLGTLAVAAIDTGLVMKVLEPIWAIKPETAGRVRGRIERVLDWAKVRGYRDGDNPARLRGHLDTLLPKKSKVHKVKHHAALPYRDVGAFMAKLREETSISAHALAFLILTATRTSEVLEVPWDEFDLDERVWTIPPERMKADKEHRVPLAPRAVAILKEMKQIRLNEYVFPGAKPGRPLSNMALAMLLRRLGYGNITAHGFRSSFRDWAAERTSFPREVAEMALAHKIPDAVEAAYRRSDLFDKRRKLMEAWAAYCTSVGAPAKVFPFKRQVV